MYNFGMGARRGQKRSSTVAAAHARTEAARASIRVSAEEEKRLLYAAKLPEEEAWLWRNEEALASVMQGLEEAAAGNLNSGPEFPS